MFETQNSARFLSSYPEDLCETCRGINAESLSSPSGLLFLARGKTLDTDTTRTQCTVCRAIRSRYSIAEKSPIERLLGTKHDGWWLRLGHGQNSTSGILRTERFGTEGVAKVLELEFFLRALPGDPAGRHGVTVVKDLTNTASKRSLEVARSWIEKCELHHRCLPSDKLPVPGLRANEPLENQGNAAEPGAIDGPKRLIDLMAFGRHSLDAQLVDEAVTDSLRYATLSYCWGSSVTGLFTTTTATLASHKERIKYSLLPLTLQQAFGFTRQLDIRYIWIDALCIIQDSESDWQDESAKMGAIYSRSFVTIAADWASEVSRGLFNKVSDNVLSDKEQSIRIRSILSNGLESTLYLGGPIRTMLPDIQNSVLTTRAWAYQERLLSPRILHFTEAQLFWECKEVVLAEDGIPRECGQIYPYPGIIARLLQERLNEDGTEGLLVLWYIFLISHNYAVRTMTIPSDKLPALSALSEIWSRHLNVPYLAGLWYTGLLWGLSWQRTGSLGVRPTTYRAPTWSWASLDGDVAWDHWGSDVNMDDSIILIEQACVDIQGSNPFGQVNGGFIILSGLMKHFYMISRDETTRLCTAEGEEVGMAFMDTDPEPRIMEGLLLLSNVPYEHQGFILLLESVPSGPDELPTFVRIGIADCASYKRHPKEKPNRAMADASELFRSCKMQTIKIL